MGRERKSLKEESLRVSERKKISVEEFRVKGRECQWKNLGLKEENVSGRISGRASAASASEKFLGR